MMNIAVDGCVLQANTGAGNIKIETPPSQKVKYDEKGAYSGTLTISISGLSGSGFTGGSGSGVLNGSAQKVKIEGKAAVLEGDQSETITVSATTTSVPPVQISVPTIVTIISAGQIKVIGE